MGRYIGTSLCISQDQQNHSLVIHDKVEDLFTTVTQISKFSHNDMSAQETSYARKCIRPSVQRYKVKHALRQNSTKLIKLFDFLYIYIYIYIVFLDFLYKNMIKANNVKAFNAKANKNSTKQCVLQTRIINLRQINKAHITHEIQGIVPTLMVLRSDSNRRPSRGLVKMSTFWLSI